MSLEDITLSEISQTQEDKYCMIRWYEVSKVVKLIEAESRMVVAWGWVGGENGEILVKGHKVSVMQDE